MKRSSLIFSAFLSLCFLFPLICPAVSLNWNSHRGYLPFSSATSRGLKLYNSSDSSLTDEFFLPQPASKLSLSFRSKTSNGKARGRVWGVFLITPSDTVLATVNPSEIPSSHESSPGITFNIRSSQVIENGPFTFIEGFDPFDGDNLWQIDLSDGIFSIFGGDRKLNQICSLPFAGYVTAFGFFTAPKCNLLVSDISVDYTPAEYFSSKTPFDFDSLDEYLSHSSDPMEGYWALFDRELEESLLKMGGNYSLACVSDGEDYIFLYLDGASVNSGDWQPGDLKLTLHQSPFPGIFDVEWLDALKAPLSRDIKAQTTDPGFLLIQFPYHSSFLRLRRR